MLVGNNAHTFKATNTHDRPASEWGRTCGRVHHPRGAADPQDALGMLGEGAAHGDEAVLLLLQARDGDAQVVQARLHALLDLGERHRGARHQRRLLQEDARLGEGHGVQERGQRLPHTLFSPKT